MMWKRQGLLAAGLATILTSCVTTGSSGPDPKVIACLVFEGMEWDEGLPEYYIRQAKEHNAKLLALCPEKRPEPVTKH